MKVRVRECQFLINAYGLTAGVYETVTPPEGKEKLAGVWVYSLKRKEPVRLLEGNIRQGQRKEYDEIYEGLTND